MDDLFTKAIDFINPNFSACARGNLLFDDGTSRVFAIGNSGRSWECAKFGASKSAFFRSSIQNTVGATRIADEIYEIVTEDDLAASCGTFASPTRLPSRRAILPTRYSEPVAKMASCGLRNCKRVFERFAGIANDRISWRRRGSVISASTAAEMARGWRGSVRITESALREKQAGDFVYGFIAHRAVNQKNPAAGEIFLPEFQQFARAGGIVRAIEVQIGLRRRAVRGGRASVRRRCRARWQRLSTGKPRSASSQAAVAAVSAF